ncbi:MAG: carbon-nitrogen hydrolase family protein [Thermodesulfobacteriota bacterium]
MNKVLGGKDKVKVAVAQVSPVYMDKDKTIEKACRFIREAGENGAELVVFPEAYIPGYPAFYTVGYETNPHDWTDFVISLQDNSISIPGEDTEILCQAAKDAGAYVVIGCNELSDRVGSQTVYNTLLYLDRNGSVLGKHRKLMPTYTERTYWGMGDGSDLDVYQTEIGRIGGLICWENHMTLVRAHMINQGEEFHVAVWPGNWKRGNEKLLDADNTDGGNNCLVQSFIRVHAFEAGSFVLSAAGYLTEEDFPERWNHIKDSDHINFDWSSGGSAIVNPGGRHLFEPHFEKDAILYAECFANQIKAVKAIFDSLGHYSRWDVAKLVLNSEGLNPETVNDYKQNIDKQINPQEVKRISDKYEIEIEKLNDMLEELKKLV